jgi:hypothetical protein
MARHSEHVHFVHKAVCEMRERHVR